MRANYSVLATIVVLALCTIPAVIQAQQAFSVRTFLQGYVME
jgi:hypothetical protein